MSIGRIILYALLIWFLYNLIFRFIVPLYRTTRQVKKKFGEMRQQMEEQMGKQEGFSQPSGTQSAQKSSSRKSSDDYIDFEEVK